MSSYPKFLYTSESVGKGHPDKLCDQIADRILDTYLSKDPSAKVAVECIVTQNMVCVFGEVNSGAKINTKACVVDVIREAGYDNASTGMDYRTVLVIENIAAQSDDIRSAVEKTELNGSLLDSYDKIGAGDQGIMFGYATNETEERIPLTLLLANRIVEEIENLRKTYEFIKSDCKSQVTIEYENRNNELVPLRIDNVVLSVQHDVDLQRWTDVMSGCVYDTSECSSGTEQPFELFRKFLHKKICAILPEDLARSTKYHILPSGKFVIGGPKGDSGLTGRKTIVDTYGGFGLHGGGSFSGKDWTKVDRSGAYAARWIAKSLVDNNICKRALVQISYAIGMVSPVSCYVDTYGTGVIDNEKIIEIINGNFDLRPKAICAALGLDKPIYSGLSVYGHFGKKGYKWEESKDLKF